MSKKEGVNADKDFNIIGEVQKKGMTIAMDILFSRDGNRYVVTIGNGEYLNDLKKMQQQGQPIGEESSQTGKAFYVEDLTNISGIRMKLFRTPMEEISEFLTLQETTQKKPTAPGLNVRSPFRRFLKKKS